MKSEICSLLETGKIANSVRGHCFLYKGDMALCVIEHFNQITPNHPTTSNCAIVGVLFTAFPWILRLSRAAQFSDGRHDSMNKYPLQVNYATTKKLLTRNNKQTNIAGSDNNTTTTTISTSLRGGYSSNSLSSGGGGSSGCGGMPQRLGQYRRSSSQRGSAVAPQRLGDAESSITLLGPDSGVTGGDGAGGGRYRRRRNNGNNQHQHQRQRHQSRDVRGEDLSTG